MSLTYLSLFSGIGGLDLGLDRAGWTCAGQVEIDPYCRAVLARHWPEVARHDDVRTAAAWWLGRDGTAVDMVCGGPPCQPASRAGLRLGDADPRWGWPWLLDVVRALGPRYVLVENPTSILDLHRGVPFGGILGALADLGFDAEWSVLSACSFGAPHTRKRLFLVAYPAGGGRTPRWSSGQGPALLEPVRCGAQPGGPWAAESRPTGVAYGIARGMDRRRAIGNAVVPAVAEHLGRLIAAHVMAGAR